MGSGYRQGGSEKRGASVSVAIDSGCGSGNASQQERFVPPLRDLPGDVQSLRQGAEAITVRLAEKDAKLSELGLKIRLVAE